MMARELLVPVRPMVFGIDGTEPVRCPLCGDDYVHHTRVIVRSREGEDLDGVEAVVANGAAQVRPCSDRFAGRRNDFRVEFWCEGCALSFALLVKQHKGCTFAEIITLPPAAQTWRDE